MATPPINLSAQSGRRRHSARFPVRWLVRAVLGLLAIVALAALALYWRQLTGTARVAAAYGARVGCSCRFVAGRPLGECRKDFEPGMRLVTLSEDAAARRITARFALLAPQSATYREGWGCQLDRWQD